MKPNLSLRMRMVVEMLSQPSGATSDEMKDAGIASPSSMMRTLVKRGAWLTSEPALPCSVHVRIHGRPKLRYRIVAWDLTP